MKKNEIKLLNIEIDIMMVIHVKIYTKNLFDKN